MTSGSIRLDAGKNDTAKTVSPSGYNSYYDQTNLNQEQEEVIHKTILVGDSGVGKTSLLVQFDQGKFQTGSFSATVGIGFTVKYNFPWFHLVVTYKLSCKQMVLQNSSQLLLSDFIFRAHEHCHNHVTRQS
ncbi:Ras-protein Rab-26 [Chamberlinius hualienensis]